MEFDPSNAVIKLCMQAMAMEEKGEPDEAKRLFLRAWEEAEDDFEKFMAAHFVARHQETVSDRLAWLERSLRFARKIDGPAVGAALPSLHARIAEAYEEVDDPDNAARHRALPVAATVEPSDDGPFFHGTKADLKPGDLLTAGRTSNYDADVVMNHIYFTALVNGAGLAAALAQGEGRERVYVVEPTGSFEHDPNVTNKKFPGNPTRSYRTQAPLEVVGEVTDWARRTPEELRKWRERLATGMGKIIN